MAGERSEYRASILHGDTVIADSLEELHILYLIDGSCRILLEGEVSLLKKFDFILINAGTGAQIKTEPDTYAALLTMPYFDLLGAFDRTSLRFFLDSTRQSGGPYRELQYLLQGFFMCSFGDPQESRLREQGLYYLILQLLKNHFLLSEDAVKQDDDRREKALEILRYVRVNHRREISLTEIAGQMYISRSAASRLFKQYTGRAFPEYLREIRLSAVRQALETTDRSVTEIALSEGFSSPSVLNRSFREAYGVSPMEYRKAHRVKGEKEDVPADESGRKQVVQILQSDMELRMQETEEVELIDLSIKGKREERRWKNRLLNVGDISMLQPAAMQQQILFLRERLGIEYLRMWGVFSRKSMIFGEEPGVFNYSFIDEMLDFCVDHQMKVMLDLTFRRERAMASDRREIYGYSSEVWFHSKEEWLAAAEQLIRHFRSRYGESVVREWVYEFGFFLGDRPFYEEKGYSNVKAFEETSRLIKEILPGARTAAPGLILSENRERDQEVIDAFLHCSTPPDIISAMHFPYRRRAQNLYYGVYEKDPDETAVENQIRYVRGILDQVGYRGEYWVTETGISLANRSFIQDSCYRGAAIASELVSCLSFVDAFGIFYASDLLNVFRDTRTVLTGSAGLLSRNGFCKPAYYGFRFVHQLGDRVISLQDGVVLTESEPGDYRLLLWNKKNLGMNYYLQDEDAIRPGTVTELFENTDPRVVELVLKDLESGKPYRIRQRILNREKGSLLQKWVDLGCSDSLSRDDLEYLDQASTPEVVADIRNAEEGVLRISFRMEANELRMIRISRE